MGKETVVVSRYLRISVDSSASLADPLREAEVAEGLAKGFIHSPEGAEKLSLRTAIVARRELHQSFRNWHWFSLDEASVSEGKDELKFRLALNVRLINEDFWVQHLGFQEREVVEIIGFYLKLRALHEQKQDILFLGRPLSSYDLKENADELWPYAAGYYAFEVLLNPDNIRFKTRAS